MISNFANKLIFTFPYSLSAFQVFRCRTLF
jgi:hypothetical protein